MVLNIIHDPYTIDYSTVKTHVCQKAYLNIQKQCKTMQSLIEYPFCNVHYKYNKTIVIYIYKKLCYASYVFLLKFSIFWLFSNDYLSCLMKYVWWIMWFSWWQTHGYFPHYLSSLSLFQIAPGSISRKHACLARRLSLQR